LRQSVSKFRDYVSKLETLGVVCLRLVMKYNEDQKYHHSSHASSLPTNAEVVSGEFL
jgi:hypothetical protein